MSQEGTAAPVDHSLLNLLRSTGLPLAVLMVGTLVDLGANIVLGRLLGPENYGDYAVALGAAVICASLANLGSSETLPKFFPAYLESSRFGLASGFLRSSFIAAIVVSFVGAAFGAFYYQTIEVVTFGHPVAIIWVVVPVLVVNTYLFNFLVALEAEVPMMAMREILRPMIMIGVLYVLIVMDRVSDNHSVVAFGVALLVMTPFYVGAVRSHLMETVRRAKPEYDVKRWMRVGWPIALAGIACDTFDQIDLQMVELIDDNQDRVGQFAAAIKISDLVFVVHAAACLVFAPRLSRLLDAGDPVEIQRFAGRIFGIVLVGAALTAVVVVAFHHHIARLFGEGFDGALAPLLILAAGNVLIAALSLAWTFLSLSDHERDPLLPIGLGLVVMMIALYFVIPRWHLAGAAACKVVASIAVYGWMTWRVRRLTGVALWKLW